MDDDRIRVAASLVIPYENGFTYVKTKKDGKWGLPGGKVNPLEDIRVAGPREVKEEIGAEVIVENLIGLWYFISEREHTVLNTIYSGKVAEGTPHNAEPEKIEKVDYFSLSKIRELYRHGELRAGLANLQPVEKYLKNDFLPMNSIEYLVNNTLVHKRLVILI